MVHCGDRFGFNGKEKENELNEGNYDFGARIYDGRLGRWLSIDPLCHFFMSQSTYGYCGENPLLFVDPDGKKRIITYIYERAEGSTEQAVVTDDDLISVKVSVDNYFDSHDFHWEYDWYDYSYTVKIKYDADGKEVSRTQSPVKYDKKRTRTDYENKWWAKVKVNDGKYENYGGVVWTSKNGKGQETKKTKEINVKSSNIDDLLSLLSNGKTTFSEKGTIDYILYALDKITNGGEKIDDWDKQITQKLKEYEEKFVYKCKHGWIYDHDGVLINKSGNVPKDKKLSKKKYICYGSN